MARPESVKIAGQPWTIVHRPLAEQNYLGYCEFDPRLITVVPDQSEWSKRDTLLHELMHAVLRSQGRPYDEDPEELYVRALATGLLGVLRDHPEIVKYLFTEKLK